MKSPPLSEFVYNTHLHNNNNRIHGIRPEKMLMKKDTKQNSLSTEKMESYIIVLNIEISQLL